MTLVIRVWRPWAKQLKHRMDAWQKRTATVNLGAHVVLLQCSENSVNRIYLDGHSSNIGMF